jgi:hypothetical protein
MTNMDRESLNWLRLVDLASGRLSGDDRVAAERDVQDSPELHAQFDAVRGTIEALRAGDLVDAPPAVTARAHAIFKRKSAATAWIERVEQVIGSLIFDSFSGSSLAGVRGPCELRQLSYEWPGARLDMDIEPLEEPDRRLIVAQVEPAGSEAVEVALVPAGSRRVVGEASADDAGVITLRVERGSYDLLVLTNGVVIKIPGLVIE